MKVQYTPNCESSLTRYIEVLVELDRLSSRIDKEYEDAPGRLRDAFEYFPRSFHLDETSMVALNHAARTGVTVIDQARDEMDRRNTKKVAAYMPSYRQNLKKAIVTAQKVVMREALANIKECACPRHREE